MRRAALVLSPLLLVACRSSMRAPRLPPPPANAPTARVREVRETFWPGTRQRKERTEVLVLPTGEVLRHGRHEEWAEDGTPLVRREYRGDEPIGTWRTWWPSGAPRSLVEIGDGRAPGAMREWSEEGALVAEGPGVGGVPEGEWTLYHPGGAVRARGTYRRGVRHGWWTFYDPAGRVTAEGEYVNGVRVGRWHHAESGYRARLERHAFAPESAPLRGAGSGAKA